MKENQKTVWVKVRYIQETEIPVTAPADWDAKLAEAAAIKKIQDRPPDSRLGPALRVRWEYEIVK